MDNLGLNSGLAVDLGFDKQIANQQNLAEYDRRMRSEAIARAKMNADEQKYQHATNPFDEALLRNDANRIFKEVGSFRQQNPDWEWNTSKRAWIENKIDGELKNNPHLIRSLQYAQAVKEYQQDAAEAQKNPLQWDMEEMNKRKQELDNYVKTGHYNGLEGLAKDQKYMAPVYSRPNPLYDVPTELMKLGSTNKNFDVKQLENGGWETAPKEATRNQMIGAALSGHLGRSIQLDARKMGIENDPKKLHEYVGGLIDNGFNKQYHPGDPYKLLNYTLALERNRISRERLNLAKGKGDGAPVRTTWDDLIDPKVKSGDLPDETYKDTYGRKPPLIINGSNGVSVDLTGRSFFSDGKFFKPDKGQYKDKPHVIGRVEDIPIEEAKDLGLVAKKGWGFDSNADNWEPASGFSKGQIEITNKYTGPDKDKKNLFVTVHHTFPLSLDNAAKMNYQNATNMPTKYRDLPDNLTGKKQPPSGAMQDDAGNIFDASGQYLGSAEDFD